MPIIKLADGTVAHVRMCRARVPKCACCGMKGGSLDCDGCDRHVCPACCVSPREGLDFCPSCSHPAFNTYMNAHGGRAVYELKGRPAGRMSFREWVRANADTFLKLAAQRTKKSLAEVGP